MPIFSKALLWLGTAALLGLVAQGKMFQPGESKLNPAAGLFDGGVSPLLDQVEDWRPLAQPTSLDLQTSVISLAYHPDINPLPEGQDYVAGSGLLLLLTLCR